MDQRGTGARLRRVALGVSVAVGLLVAVGLALRPALQTEAGGPAVAAWAEPPTQEEIAARAGFGVLWPAALPPGAVLAYADVGEVRRRVGEQVEVGRRVDLVWHAEQPAREPIFRLVQAPLAAPLDGGQEVAVRGRAGRLVVTPLAAPDPTTGPERPGQQVNLQWVEDGLAVSLTSRSLSVADVLRLAEGLQPQPVARAAFRERRVSGREGERVAVGRPEAFPVPSVTHLPDPRAYLVRTSTGFLALVDDDPHRHHPTAWNEARQLFVSPAHGETYDWRGNCLAGPCPRGLDRYLVEVRDGQVIVDTRQRLAPPPPLVPPSRGSPTWP